MKREDPLGYAYKHPEENFIMKTTQDNLHIECIAKHNGKVEKVS